MRIWFLIRNQQSKFKISRANSKSQLIKTTLFSDIARDCLYCIYLTVDCYVWEREEDIAFASGLHA